MTKWQSYRVLVSYLVINKLPGVYLQVNGKLHTFTEVLLLLTYFYFGSVTSVSCSHNNFPFQVHISCLALHFVSSYWLGKEKWETGSCALEMIFEGMLVLYRRMTLKTLVNKTRERCTSLLVSSLRVT